jgi:hypothetical protein
VIDTSHLTRNERDVIAVALIEYNQRPARLAERKRETIDVLDARWRRHVSTQLLLALSS